MRLTSEGLRELYQKETSRAARHGGTDCLLSETLTRAAAGELSHHERELVADHLGTCSDCANEYSSIRSLQSWTENVANTVPEAPKKNGSEPSQLPVLRQEQVSRAYNPSLTRPVGSRPFPFYVPYAIAAALLLLGLALGSLLISQRRENQRLIAELHKKPVSRDTQTAGENGELREARRLLEEASGRAQREEAARRAAEDELGRRRPAKERSPIGTGQSQSIQTPAQSAGPYVNIPIFDLDPRGSVRGQDGAATTLEIPHGTDLFTLILNITGEQLHSNYSLEVQDHRGLTVWTGGGLRKTPYNNFSVALPRGLFPSGMYRLKLYGMRDGGKALVQEYAMRLVYR